MKSICVFAGSNPGARIAYTEAASVLGRELAVRGLVLVYGGGNLGLMESVADAALDAGGEVIGVIPQALLDQGRGHDELTERHIVTTMHERKAKMAHLSDGFIALPGGIGTLEEFAEMVTWTQLGFQAKPCGLLEVGGYFSHLLDFLDHAVTEKFLKPEHRALVLTEREPGKLIERLADFRGSTISKWYNDASAEQDL
jgi:uncharacterized protein (TIGR00730 family)